MLYQDEYLKQVSSRVSRKVSNVLEPIELKVKLVLNTLGSSQFGGSQKFCGLWRQIKIIDKLYNEFINFNHIMIVGQMYYLLLKT